jgi:uroporphyrinogen decarboxylase
MLAPWPVIERAAGTLLEQAGDQPGYIFNLGHGIIPETDPEKLARLVTLVHQRP